jgi:hypothetical protein
LLHDLEKTFHDFARSATPIATGLSPLRQVVKTNKRAFGARPDFFKAFRVYLETSRIT